MHAIEDHLSECLFCSDAMEGYEKQVDKAKVQQDFQSIKNEFLLKHNNHQEFKKKDNKRYLVLAMSLAASFVLIISGYYLFQILPTNSKQQDMALNTPANRNDIVESQIHTVPKEEMMPSEKSGSKGLSDDRSKDKGDLTSVSESESQQKSDKITKSENASKYFDKSEGWLETDGDGITTTKAIGKSAEYKPVVNGGSTIAIEQSGERGVVVTEDAEFNGKIADVTIAMDQKEELKKESVTVETQTLVDEVFSGNNIRSQEKVVSGKKNRNVVSEANEKQPMAATGGVMRTELTPTLNSAMSLYNAGNYEQARSEFEYLVEHEKTNYAAMYYLAMCQYTKGDKDNAIIQLEKLTKKKNNPFYELGMWQKAQIVEESNDKKQAAEIYREIIKNNGSMKTKAAQKVGELEK
jgi:tetratricopeptide (TPR) repeat protein